MHIVFNDEENEWLVRETFNWHVKDGCPSHIRESLEEKLKRLEEAEWDHMRSMVANASQDEKDKMETEIQMMKEIRKRQREQLK